MLLASFQLVADINPGSNSSFAFDLTSFQAASDFPADDGMHRFGLWKSDGTTAGTTLVKDTFMPGYFTQVGGVVVLPLEPAGFIRRAVEDRWHARRHRPSVSRWLFDHRAQNDGQREWHVVLSATDNNGTELWKSDGTVAGTVLVKDIVPGKQFHAADADERQRNVVFCRQRRRWRR